MLPEGGTVPGHLFVMSDIHGRADLFERALVHIDAIKASRQPTTLVIAGDLIDRGPESLRCLSLAMEAEHRFDRRIILPGNHEWMLLASLDDWRRGNIMVNWLKWGGRALRREVDPDGMATAPHLQNLLRDALPDGFVTMIRSAPSHHKEGDVIVVHAGIDPRQRRGVFLAQPLSRPEGDCHWAWIQEPFLSWPHGWDGGNHSRTVVVHGHTTSAAARFNDGIDMIIAMDRVADRRRINLDIGGHCFDQLGLLEVCDSQYRLHAIRDHT